MRNTYCLCQKSQNPQASLCFTLAASAGYAKNWKDFGENLIANGVANTAGLIFDQLSRSKGVGRLIRKPVKQLLNYSTDKAKNWYYDGDDE